MHIKLLCIINLKNNKNVMSGCHTLFSIDDNFYLCDCYSTNIMCLYFTLFTLFYYFVVNMFDL